MIVDDVVCFVGSTDLSRRGLTFDASLLVGVTDEVARMERPRHPGIPHSAHR